MSFQFLRRLVASRLLRPVFVILVVAGVAQVVVSQWLIASQVDRLVQTAGSALESSSAQVNVSFGETREDVRTRLEAMRQKTTRELSAELTRQQTEQQERVAGNVRAAVVLGIFALTDRLGVYVADLDHLYASGSSDAAGRE